jgi:serine-type D-Ala-D-Ala carboxypeptidase/endopeptidase (penicillin-binding protein 4)
MRTRMRVGDSTPSMVLSGEWPPIRRGITHATIRSFVDLGLVTRNEPIRLERMARMMLASHGRQRPCVIAIMVAALMIATALPPGWSSPSSGADLNGAVKKLLQDPCFHRGRIGMRGFGLTSGQALLDVHGEALLIPASTAKLVTSAAALFRLSPQYRFRSAFLTTAPVANGVIQGDVFLKGYGDPSLVLEEAWLMARGLRKQGVNAVRGDLVGDESFFDAEQRGPAWADAHSQRAFNARIGALSINFNSVSLVARPGVQPGEPVTVEVEPSSADVAWRNTATTANQGQGHSLSVTRVEGEAGDTLMIEGTLAVGGPPQTIYRNISQPGLHATMVMWELLEREGVHIAGRPRLGRTPPTAREVYVHQSRPLYRIIDDLNKFSNNFIAEQVLKTLGAEVYGPPGTWSKGLAVVREVLEEFGIAPGSYNLADGSGLSRLNRLSPALLVTVLTHMAKDFRVQPEYVASLRTPDAEGRVGLRFRGADFEQRARVKTGALDDVSALAGYVGRSDGEWVAFAVLMNGPFCSMERAWQLQDAIVEQLIRAGR